MKWTTCVKELLALHEAFRKLGYSSDDLFVVANGGSQILFLLKYKEKEFTINVAMNQNVEEVVAEWKRAVVWWNLQSTEKERDNIYNHALMVQDAPGLVMALIRKGIYPIEPKPKQKEEILH